MPLKRAIIACAAFWILGSMIALPINLNDFRSQTLDTYGFERFLYIL